MRLYYKGLTLCAALLLCSSLGAAQTITFNSYTDGQYVTPPIVESGVELHSWTPQFLMYASWGYPTTAASPTTSPTDHWVLRSDGNAFDFVSIDWNNFSYLGAVPVTFVGIQVDGTIVSQTITSNGDENVVETMAPTGMTDLRTLSIFNAEAGQIDNLVTTASSATPPAGSRTMTFDNMGYTHNQSLGGTIAQDGLQVTVPTLGFTAGATSGWANPGIGVAMTGGPWYILISRTGGQPFDFLSIDCNELNSSWGSKPVTFTGTKWVGGTVTETLMADGNVDNYERIAPTGNFTMLTELKIEFDHIFDNIRVTDSMVLPTEQSTWGKVKSIYSN